MTRLPRRHFFQARNEIHYNKENKMENIEFVRGEIPLTHKVQESIDTLNAAIDRLDQIIKDMTKTVEGEK
jgi:uncharacterized protein YqhQ